MKQAKAKMQRKLCGKKGREGQLGVTPMSTQDRWVKDSIDKLQKEVKTTQGAGRTQLSRERIISKWAQQMWE